MVDLNHPSLSPLSEAHLRGAMDALPVPVAAFDPLGRVLCWNREAQRITGWSFQDLQAGALERLFPHPIERALMIEEWGRRGEGFEGWEWMVTGKGGHEHRISWTCQTTHCPLPCWAIWMVGAAKSKEAPIWRPPFYQSAM